MRDLTARLSEGVATDPPPSLRTSILAEINVTPQQTASDRRSAGRSTRVSPARESELATVIPLRRSWSSRATALVAAAAVLGAVGFGGWAVQARNDAKNDAQTASAQVEQFTRLLAAPDVETKSATSAQGTTATVVRSADERAAILVASELPALPNGRVYEAWTVDGDVPSAAGTFDSDGGRATVALPDSAVDTEQVVVTIEPDGGSIHPTTSAVLLVDLADA